MRDLIGEAWEQDNLLPHIEDDLRIGAFQMSNLKERFFSRVDRNGINGCWIWTGRLDRYGYGRMRADKDNTTAHRVSYEIHKGPIPEGLQIDHLCCVRKCVNPDHLEAVTASVNGLRAQARLGRLPTWESLYRDLYKQVYGEQVTEHEWRQDAQQRRRRLGL